MIADNFKLDQICVQGFPRETRGTNSFFGRVAAGGIWQELELRIKMIEKRLHATIERHPSDCHRNHLGAGSAMRSFHFVVAAILPCPNNQPRSKCATGNLKTIGVARTAVNN